jgi:hypothetical protein
LVREATGGTKHFEVALEDLRSDAQAGGDGGAFLIRAVSRRRVAEKARILKHGWAAGQSIPVVKRDGKYVLVDANHRYHGLYQLIEQKWEPDKFNPQMKLSCIEIKGAPDELVIQYANWLNTTQMSASQAHQIDKLRFCAALLRQNPNLSAADLRKQLSREVNADDGTLGASLSKSEQIFKKTIGMTKALGKAGLLEAERLNDLCDPGMLHGYFKQMWDDQAQDDLKLPGLFADSPFQTQKQKDCFLPETTFFAQLPWNTLAKLANR